MYNFEMRTEFRLALFDAGSGVNVDGERDVLGAARGA